MPRLALRQAAFLCAFCAAAAAALSPGAASAAPGHFGPMPSALTLNARAGIGGLGRPGRWLPVEVAVSSDTSGPVAELRVEWGDAVAFRDVAIEPGTRRITVLLRAIAAAPVVHVTLTRGEVITTVDAPIELASLDEPLTLCIGETDSAPCTVRVNEDAAPSTWRGFDVADAVIWPAIDRSQRREAVAAFETWRAMRWLGDAGPSDPVLPPFDAQSPTAAATARRLVWFGLVVSLVTAFAAWRRLPVSLALALPAIAGVVGAALLSPIALARDSVTAMQVTGVVHQFARTPNAIVSLKADIEQPSAAPLWLRPSLHEATLATNGPGTIRAVSALDSDGRAVYRSAAGLGARRRAALDGTIDSTWLEVIENPGDITLRNRAPFALSDCHWSGSSGGAIGTLSAGAVIRTSPRTAPAPGDAITCTLPNDWLSWSSSARGVDVRGQTYFVFHFWPDHAR